MLNDLTELPEWLFFHHNAKPIEFTTHKEEEEIFLRILLLENKKKMSLTLDPVLFINALPFFSCSLWNVWVLRGRLQKQTQKPREAVTERQDQLWHTLPFLCSCKGDSKPRPVGGIHTSSNIRWLSANPLYLSAYWQLPQVDSNSTEAGALRPFSFSAHTNCFIQEPLYFFFFFLLRGISGTF